MDIREQTVREMAIVLMKRRLSQESEQFICSILLRNMLQYSYLNIQYFYDNMMIIKLPVLNCNCQFHGVLEYRNKMYET